VCILRIDAALSFVNAVNVKRLILSHVDELERDSGALVLDASGINDLDATGAEMLDEILIEVEERHIALHLTDVKGPVRDVLRAAGIWDQLGNRVHSSTNDALIAIAADRPGPVDQRRYGVDEHSIPGPSSTDTALSSNGTDVNV